MAPRLALGNDLGDRHKEEGPGVSRSEPERRRAPDGTTVVTIDTQRPWGVATVAGEARFEVAAEWLTEIDWG